MYVEQTGALFAGTVTFDPVTGLPIAASGDGIDAAAAAEADAELRASGGSGQYQQPDATTNLDLHRERRPLTRLRLLRVASADGTTSRSKPGSRTSRLSSRRSRRISIRRTTADQYAEADAYAGYEGDDAAVTVIQSGLLVAADTGIDAEARAEAEADLEQIADQGNDNSQTATPTVAFTAAPIFGTAAGDASATDVGVDPSVTVDPGGVAVAACDDVEIDAGIEDVEVEVSQEQEDIDQENEAEQDGAAYATADYSGDVFVEQSGTLTAGTLISDGDWHLHARGRWHRRIVGGRRRGRPRAGCGAEQQQQPSTSPKTLIPPTPAFGVHRGRDLQHGCGCCGRRRRDRRRHRGRRG